MFSEQIMKLRGKGKEKFSDIVQKVEFKHPIQ